MPVHQHRAGLLGQRGGSRQDHQGQNLGGAEEDCLGGAGPAVSRTTFLQLSGGACMQHTHTYV